MAFLRKVLPAIASGVLGALMVCASASAAAELVIIVSSQSVVTTLAREHLADIYLGRLRRFPDGTVVIPVDQAERSFAYERFYRRYLGLTPEQVKMHWSKQVFTGRGRPPQAVRDASAMVGVVAGNPNAIGYVDSGLVDERLRVVGIE